MNDADNRIEEFVAKVGMFARQYPEFKYKVYSSEVAYQCFAKVVHVLFTAPNGKEQVMFCMMIDSVYNPYGEEEFNAELYNTLIDELDREFDNLQNERV